MLKCLKLQTHALKSPVKRLRQSLFRRQKDGKDFPGIQGQHKIHLHFAFTLKHI